MLSAQERLFLCAANRAVNSEALRDNSPRGELSLSAPEQKRRGLSSFLVECRQDRAAETHGQKPVAGIDGK
jgi:hypothetical protein